MYDKLEENQLKNLLDLTKNHNYFTKIQIIQDKDHPCCGQRGLFANRFIHKDEFLGEYTGILIRGKTIN